jgi:hypothetical protein
MDSYVIRIYRRDEEDSGNAAGLVEIVEKGQRRSFTSVEELVEILGLKKRTPTNKPKTSLAVRESSKRERRKP